MPQHPPGLKHAVAALAATLDVVGVAGEDTGPRRSVGPVCGPAQNAAQAAHALAWPCYGLRGERRAKSSAISFMVTKRTPGWLAMWW